MNKYTRPDPWREIFQRRGGVLGGDLRCTKGAWTLSDEPAETGDAGLKICILWPTARHGERQYRDGVGNKYRDVQLYIDGAPSDERLELGWEPLTQFQAIAQDEAHVGQLVTFTSYAWGGRNAFENLIGDYLSKGGQQFPVVALDVRPKRNDPNGNIDPVFRIVGWKAADDFADMVANILPQPAPQPLALEPPKRAEPESDEGLEPGADPDDDTLRRVAASNGPRRAFLQGQRDVINVDPADALADSKTISTARARSQSGRGARVAEPAGPDLPSRTMEWGERRARLIH